MPAAMEPLSAAGVVLAVGTIFLLELGLGCLILLPFFSSREIGRGFFALHGGIGAGAVLLAALIDRGGRVVPGSTWLLATIAIAVVGTVSSGLGKHRAAHGVFAIAAAVAASTLFLTPIGVRGSAWLGATWFLSGTLLLSSTTMTMNLGHWYLVTRDLDHRHLLRWSWVNLGAACARGAIFATVAIALWRGHYGLEMREALFSFFGDGFFVATRFLWGVVGTITLGVFIVKTAQMRSNQAATGLLYVALVFAMVGELVAVYLTVRSGVPL